MRMRGEAVAFVAAVDFTVASIAEISTAGSVPPAISIVALAEFIETQLFGETSEAM
jgi:hypothetical protein